MRRLVWACAGRTYHIVGNLMSRLICTNKPIKVETICVSENEILYLSHVRKCLIINAHGEVSSKARSLNFWQSLHVHLYFAYASNEGSGESARMRRLAWVFGARWCDTYRNLVQWRITIRFNCDATRYDGFNLFCLKIVCTLTVIQTNWFLLCYLCRRRELMIKQGQMPSGRLHV